MRCGSAAVDITPEIGSGADTVGFGQLETPVCSGVESKLYARAMSIATAEEEDCHTIVVCDCLVIPNEVNSALVEACSATTFEPRATTLILSATHTHSAPIVQDLFGMSVSKEDDSNFVSLLRAGILKASGSLSGWGFNRRFLMCDGNIETHPLKGDPRIVEPEGPDSDRIEVLCAVGAEKPHRALGAIITYGCHPTVMERRNRLISADFPGKVVQHVEKALSSTAPATKRSPVPVLFLQGASGNICQVNPRLKGVREVGGAWTARMGAAIGAKAVEMIRSMGLTGVEASLVADATATADGDLMLTTTRRTLEIARRQPDPKLVRWAIQLQRQEEEKRTQLQERYRPPVAPVLSDYGSEDFGTLFGRACGCQCASPVLNNKISLEDLFKTEWWAWFYAREILTLEQDRLREPSVKFEVKVVSCNGSASGGTWALVSIPGELFVEWAEEIKRASPFDVTTVVTLANGYHGYIPTAIAFARKGGYETKELTSTKLDPSAGELVAEAATSLLREAHARAQKRI